MCITVGWKEWTAVVLVYVGISKAKLGLILGSDFNKALTHILLTLPLTWARHTDCVFCCVHTNVEITDLEIDAWSGTCCSQASVSELCYIL